MRVHRAGEHAQYTVHQPAGPDVGPVLLLAEKAVETGGGVERAYELLADELHRQLSRRLLRVRQLADGRDASVAAARDYVQAALGSQVYATTCTRRCAPTPTVNTSTASGSVGGSGPDSPGGGAAMTLTRLVDRVRRELRSQLGRQAAQRRAGSGCGCLGPPEPAGCDG